MVLALRIVLRSEELNIHPGGEATMGDFRTHTTQRPVRAMALAVGLALSASLLGGAGLAQASVKTEVGSVQKAATTAHRHSVYRLYRAYFLRDPEPAGWDYWSNTLASGRMSLIQISEFFSRSDEFKKRYGSLSDAEFIDLVYRNVLGRSPDGSGRSHWVGRLSAGETRGMVMVGFSESDEFQRKTGTVPPAPPAVSWSAELMALVNGERARAGLPALTSCPALTRAAQAHAADQAAYNRLSHVGSDGASLETRLNRSGYLRAALWAENVANGYPTPATAMAGWLASPNHRPNILNPAFTHIGLGRAVAANGTVYWTQDFGTGGTC